MKVHPYHHSLTSGRDGGLAYTTPLMLVYTIPLSAFIETREPLTAPDEKMT